MTDKEEETRVVADTPESKHDIQVRKIMMNAVDQLTDDLADYLDLPFEIFVSVTAREKDEAGEPGYRTRLAGNVEGLLKLEKLLLRSLRYVLKARLLEDSGKE